MDRNSELVNKYSMYASCLTASEHTSMSVHSLFTFNIVIYNLFLMLGKQTWSGMVDSPWQLPHGSIEDRRRMTMLALHSFV